MLGIAEDFLVIFTELGTFMILWSKFYLKEKSSWVKNLIIIITTSFISSISQAYFDNNYIIFLNYIFVIFLVKIIYNRALNRIVIEFFIILLINIAIQAFIIMITELIGFKYSDTFILNFSLILIELFLIIIICHFTAWSKRMYSFKIHSKIVYYFIINLGLAIVVPKLIWEYNSNLILNNLVTFIIGLSIILFLNLSLYLYVAKINEEKRIFEIQSRYTPLLGDMIEEIRRRQHDFKNYINTINGIIDVAIKEEVKKELKDYIRSVNYSNKSIEDIIYIDNTIVKAIVYNKLCEAEKKGIKFLFNISNDALQYKLKDYELSDILNNLLNNAFEAVESKNDNKVIILNMIKEKNKNIIEVKNSGITVNSGDIHKIFRRGYSSKKGKNRGYGLCNIKKIVEGNGASLQLSFKDNYTIFKILFK